LTEIKPRMRLLKKVNDHKVETVKKGIIDLPRTFIDQVLTITCDTNVYFAHSHAAWERGTNENANCFLRQYFHKRVDFTNLTGREICLVVLR
jgi:IS30 family transposase